MFSSRDAFENDFCPVRDELLGEMYRASEHGLPKLVESVTPEVRAMLALFCYRRSHLHQLALAIAGSCTERELVEVGGRVGSTLYAVSRRVFRALIRRRFWQRPQADYALDQAALHLQTARRRDRRRGFHGSCYGLTPTAGRPLRRRAMLHSTSPGRQMRQTSGRAA